MDSMAVSIIKQDTDDPVSLDQQVETNEKLAESQSSGDDLADLDRESNGILHEATDEPNSIQDSASVTSTNTSPDQLNDLQSYLVTFNKEIGHGGQSTGYTISEVEASNITAPRQVLYNTADGQVLNVAPNLQSNQDLSSAGDDTKVEISMTTSDALDPQSQTLRLAESISEGSALLEQNNPISSQNALQIQDQQRTVMLQEMPGAPGTLVQVNLPGPSRQIEKIIPSVVSLDGKEQLLLDSAAVVPQIIQVSQPSAPITSVIGAVKTEINTPSTSTVTGLETLPVHGVQIGQADITNAQLIAIPQTENVSGQLVTVNNPQDMQLIGGNESETNSNNFQTVTIVPTSAEQGGEMNYVLIVSQPDGEKDGTSPKQFALDMGMFDFKDGRELVEEVVDEEGNTRKIIRVNPKKFEMLPSTINQLQCHYCNYTAPKRYLLMRHMKTHSEDRPYQCNLCEKSFKTHASLQNHVNTHTGVRPHKCKDCEMAFTTSGELVRHIRYKHTFEKPHKCTECDYASVELSKLKRHMRSHTGERPYQCPHCQYASPDTYKLKRHLRIHTGEKPYECDVCHARFTQSNSLKAHKLIHSGLKPVFQCELCPTTCGRKTDLKIHMMKLHSNDKPVDCKKCGMVFQDRYSFKLHLKTHDGEKCFKCDQCDYAALSQRHLESHLLTHTGEKPFECDECEQTFRQKQLLKRHKNLYHTPDYNRPEPKEKNFECGLCDKAFANRGNLIRHMQNHDPEYWNKKLSEGTNTSISTDDLIQGSLLSDMRDGKLGVAPKVVIVHPNGSVEEVTSRLQNLVAEKQMEEMMVEVVRDANNPTAVTTQSLEDAIRSQVEAAIQSHALKAIQRAKLNSGEESTTDNLTIDLEGEQSLSGHTKVTLSASGEKARKAPDHVIIVKPRSAPKKCTVTSATGDSEENSDLPTTDGPLLSDEVSQEDSNPMLGDTQSEDMDLDDTTQS